MTRPEQPTSWQRANQAWLGAALAKLRAALGEVAGLEPTPSMPSPEWPENLPPPAFEEICDTFELGPERSLLLLCTGSELDPSIADLCARVQGDGQRRAPTFALARTLFPEIPWSAVTPGGRLRFWRLIEVGPADSLTLAPLRIDELVLHYVVGAAGLDEYLARLLRPVPPARHPLASRSHTAATLVAAVATYLEREEEVPLLQLYGSDPASRRDLAADVCASLGCGVCRMAAEALPLGTEFETFLRLVQRHTLLQNEALLIEHDELDPTDRAREGLLCRMEDEMGGLLLLSGRERRGQRQRPLLSAEVGPPTLCEQRDLWRQALAESGLEQADAELLIGQFQLGATGIRAACAEAKSRMNGNGELAPSLLWNACRAQARSRLGDLAQRIETKATWQDLVLADEQLGLLRQIVVQVRNRFRVHEIWGFAGRGSRGLGISALFSGLSGTGKTMAAEVLAGELEVDLFRIDLSMVFSKYIGETEKNLGRIFAAAEEGGAALLFDEADALFGKRSEVRDSHDRYANVEVSYLLQRMESYRGLSILTTNLKESLDPAFLRRIGTVVDFPFPDRAQRLAQWSRVFPPETPTEGLDFDKLARLNTTGGHIRNIALNAAFRAADTGEPVRMAHLAAAARSELAKLGRLAGQGDIQDWK